MRVLLKHGLLFIIYGSLSSIAVIIIVYVMQLQDRPDLHAWHLIELDEEFTASQSKDINTLAVYQYRESGGPRNLSSKLESYF